MSMHHYPGSATVLMIPKEDFAVLEKCYGKNNFIDKLCDKSSHETMYCGEDFEYSHFASYDNTVGTENEECIVIFTEKIPNMLSAAYSSIDEVIKEFEEDDAIPNELIKPERIGYFEYVTFG